MRMTPREFDLLLIANREKTLDVKEQQADVAIMQRIASNKEKLTYSDLFVRPQDSVIAKYRGELFEDEVEEQQKAQDFLSTVKFE